MDHSPQGYITSPCLHHICNTQTLAMKKCQYQMGMCGTAPSTKQRGAQHPKPNGAMRRYPPTSITPTQGHAKVWGSITPTRGATQKHVSQSPQLEGPRHRLATSPLPFGGSPTLQGGGQNQKWPTNWAGGYITPSVSGVPNASKRGTKSAVGSHFFWRKIALFFAVPPQGGGGGCV